MRKTRNVKSRHAHRKRRRKLGQTGHIRPDLLTMQDLSSLAGAYIRGKMRERPYMDRIFWPGNPSECYPVQFLEEDGAWGWRFRDSKGNTYTPYQMYVSGNRDNWRPRIEELLRHCGVIDQEEDVVVG